MITPIRLLIVDDDPNVRRGLRMRLSLEPGMAVVGEAADGESGVQQAAALHPDVVVLDLDLPTLDGLTACRLIRDRSIAVVVLSLEDDARARERCLEAGASSFVSKQEPAWVLLAAIRSAAGSPPPSPGPPSTKTVPAPVPHADGPEPSPVTAPACTIPALFRGACDLGS